MKGSVSCLSSYQVLFACEASGFSLLEVVDCEIEEVDKPFCLSKIWLCICWKVLAAEVGVF